MIVSAWGMVQHWHQWHYRFQELALSLQAFAAPRILCWNGWVAQHPIVPGRSVGAGARAGNDLARVYTYSWVEHIVQTSIGLTLAQWVDDVPMRSIGTPTSVRRAIIRAVATSSEMLAEDGLILAEKTIVAVTGAQIAIDIQRDLRRRGRRRERVEGQRALAWT